MSAHVLQDSPQNTLGALIFTAYVISALFLTAFISRDLLLAYRSLSQSHRTTRDGRPLQTRLTVSLSLCILSFSVLSYHMLSFLIDSYCAWAQERQIFLPSSLMGSNGTLPALIGLGERKVLIWQWLKTSTLFEDFARCICDDWARCWWTIQYLVMTMGVNVWMGGEGRKVEIPHLWAYFAIAQILPISFAQNLFTTAKLLPPTPAPQPSSAQTSQTSKPTPAIEISRGLQSTIFVFFFALLTTLPLALNTALFIPNILVLRLLLLLPLFLRLDKPAGSDALTTIVPISISTASLASSSEARARLLGSEEDAVPRYRFYGLMIMRIAAALNDNHAMQALGYDMLISIISG